MNIWLTNDLSFRLWLSINTARDFEGYQNEEEEIKQMAQNNDDEHGPLSLNSSMPPIRKVQIMKNDGINYSDKILIFRRAYLILLLMTSVFL